jgi:hypothetical protein
MTSHETYEQTFAGAVSQNHIEVNKYGAYFAKLIISGRGDRQVTLGAKGLEHHIAACQARLAEIRGAYDAPLEKESGS